MNFPVVSRVKSLGHSIDDSFSTIGVYEEKISGRVDAQTLDFPHIVEFLYGSKDGDLPLKGDLVYVIGLAFLCIAIICALKALRASLNKATDEAAYFERQALAAQPFLSEGDGLPTASPPPTPLDSLDAALAASST